MNEENRVKLKVTLEMKGVTNRKLAEFLHISEQSVSNKIRGLQPFKLKEIKAICSAYNIDPLIFL